MIELSGWLPFTHNRLSVRFCLSLEKWDGTDSKQITDFPDLQYVAMAV